LCEDQAGDLWVGTASGLERFDKAAEVSFHYQHDPDDPQSLGGTGVLSIHEDRVGALWIGTTDGGLDRLDPATGAFVHYRHDPDDPGTLSDNSVRAIQEDRDGALWVGTDGGLNRLDPVGGSFTRYQHDSGDPDSLSDNRVRAILEDQQGTLWVGTDGGGLDGLDRSTQAFAHYRHDPAAPSSLSSDRVLALSEDHTGRLWAGTRGGLDQVILGWRPFVHYRHDPYDSNSLGADAVSVIYEDRSGVLWIGTEGGGLGKTSPATNQFGLYRHRPNDPNSLSNNNIESVFADRHGMLWIGTKNGGLNKLDRRFDTFTVFQHDPTDPTSLGGNEVRAILEDRAGVLWVGTYGGGLDRLDPETGTFVDYRHNPGDPTSLSDNRVQVLYEDRSDNLWIGTWGGGLNRLDRTTGTFVHYHHDPDEAGSKSTERVMAIHEDTFGRLWVGTFGGISILDRTADRLSRSVDDLDVPPGLSSNVVFSIHQDRMGMIWFGTHGNGLIRHDPHSGMFTDYTERDGLASNTVYGILSDWEGFLWISTGGGLSSFDPRTETFHNYTVQDGLQGNQFNAGALFQGAKEEMFFGGVQGLNAFYPLQVRMMANPHPPPLAITAFSIFNEVVRVDLPLDEHIELPHTDNFISFEFAALDYTLSEKNEFAYMLEGLDKDWVDAGSRRHADYPNLEWGDYLFRVKGSNNDGVWNEEGVSLRITISPPFWATWWFRGMAIIVVVGGVITYYRLRVRSIEASSRALGQLVQERTREIGRRTQELEALYRADEELYRHLDLNEVFQALVDAAVDILGAEKSSLMVWDQDREKLVVRAARNFSPATIALMTFAPGEGAVGQVGVTGEPVIIEDTHAAGHIASRVTEPEGIRSLMHVPIEIGGQIFGVFNADYLEPRSFDKDELRLFAALAQRAALAIENAQLYEQAQELAAVEERQRLARDLHDAVTQTLFSASLIAEVLPDLWDADQDEGRQLLGELRQLSRGALAEMRTLLLELRPDALMEASLGDLLRQLGEATTGRKGIPVKVVVEGEPQCPPDVHVALYRITQEALNNMVKHSQASQVTVSLQCQPDNGGVELCISDDGRGFDATRIASGHLGLGIMHERARAIGATLEIESELGSGTRIVTMWRKDGGYPDE
ncbi:MAG: GAF domain-containing protein, partial [Ardenticatenales bacterium]|nr:GAF domain-containing protein [Ardenticatenales bacterium]